MPLKRNTEKCGLILSLAITAMRRRMSEEMMANGTERNTRSSRVSLGNTRKNSSLNELVSPVKEETPNGMTKNLAIILRKSLQTKNESYLPIFPFALCD